MKDPRIRKPADAKGCTFRILVLKLKHVATKKFIVILQSKKSNKIVGCSMNSPDARIRLGCCFWF